MVKENPHDIGRRGALKVILGFGGGLVSCFYGADKALAPGTTATLPFDIVTVTPNPTQAPESTVTPLSQKDAQPAVEPQDFTPENAPTKFTQYGFDWYKETGIDGRPLYRIKNPDGTLVEGKENITIGFHDFYDGRIKDKFMADVQLGKNGRLHFLIPLRAGFLPDFSQSDLTKEYIGETLLVGDAAKGKPGLSSRMNDSDARTEVVKGAEVYVVVGLEPDFPRNIMSRFDSSKWDNSLIPANGVGNFIAIGGTNPSVYTGPFLEEDGRLQFGAYWAESQIESLPEAKNTSINLNDKTSVFNILSRSFSCGIIAAKQSKFLNNNQVSEMAQFMKDNSEIIWQDKNQ